MEECPTFVSGRLLQQFWSNIFIFFTFWGICLLRMFFLFFVFLKWQFSKCFIITNVNVKNCQNYHWKSSGDQDVSTGDLFSCHSLSTVYLDSYKCSVFICIIFIVVILLSHYIFLSPSISGLSGLSYDQDLWFTSTQAIFTFNSLFPFLNYTSVMAEEFV